jgi:hypothetical protein
VCRIYHRRAGILALLAMAWGAAQAAEPPRQIDPARLAAAGLRVLDGKYAQIVTDLPSSPGVDELPAVFDAAVPQWAAYFDVPEANLADAKWLCFVVEDRDTFAALGLMPAERPDFLSGYANGWEFWLAEQPSDYYRRHLMLHEGTHAFMQTQLGGAGPGWYMEGMAELLGTHEWRDGKLRLGAFPANRDDVPMWGRIKLIRDAFDANHAWPLERVLAVDNSRVMSTDEYAWTWALAALLDAHPQFQERFRSLRGGVNDPQFTAKVRRLLADDWRDLEDAWQAFVAEVDYGYDVPRMEIAHAETAPVESASRRSRIDVNRGWQSAGWLLRGGESYRVMAAGRYEIVRDGETWPCESGGVSIEYFNGRPVGALLGALRYVDATHSGPHSFERPMLIGLEATITPQRDAVLYVRVNDSPATVGSNEGEIALRIEHLAPGSSNRGH